MPRRRRPPPYSSRQKAAWPPSSRKKKAALSLPPVRCDRYRPGPTSVGRQAPGRDLLLGRVLGRGILDHGRYYAVVAGVPIRRDLPVLAVPGLDAAGARAFMVLARYFDGLQHAFEAELLDAIGGDVEVLEAQAHLLAGQRLLAEFFLGRADRLDSEHGVDQPADVENLSGLLPLRRALSLVVDVLLQILVQLELTGRVLQRDRVVALGAVLGRPHVGLRARPPNAVHLLARIADCHRLLDGGRVHHAPAPQQDVVGTVLPYLQPGRLLLHAGMGHRQEHGFKAVLLRTLLQQRDRLLAVGRVVINERDLLALELVEAAFLLGDVLKDDVGGGPIGAEQREVPLEHRTIARLGAAVPHGDDRYLVGGGLLGEREGHARRQRDHVGGARGAVLLEALVALDAAVRRIAELAFLGRDLDAVDAAVARIHQLVVVGNAVGERHAVGRVGAGPIDQRRDELLVLGERRRGDHRAAKHRREREPDMFFVHFFPPLTYPDDLSRPVVAGFYPASGYECARELSRPQSLSLTRFHFVGKRFSTGTATAEASPWRSPRGGRGRAARRSRRTRSGRRTA